MSLTWTSPAASSQLAVAVQNHGNTPERPHGETEAPVRHRVEARESQAIHTEQRAQHHLHLVHRKGRAETPPAPAAEWDVFERRELPLEESLGLEAIRLGIKVCPRVQDRHRGPDPLARRDREPQELERLPGDARDVQHRWMEPQRFEADRFEER